MEEYRYVRFDTVAHNRITKADGRRRSCWCEAWDFCSLKHSHSGFLLFTIHVALNVNIKFSEKIIASFLGFVVYLRSYLSTQKEEKNSIQFLYNETRRQLDIPTGNEC
jgi:hypothetical protein